METTTLWLKLYVVLSMISTRCQWFCTYHMMTSSNGNISALLAICAGNSPVPERPLTWSFDVNYDLRPNKRLSKQSWGWWFENPLRLLWRHRNELVKMVSLMNIVSQFHTNQSATLTNTFESNEPLLLGYIGKTPHTNALGDMIDYTKIGLIFLSW